MMSFMKRAAAALAIAFSAQALMAQLPSDFRSPGASEQFRLGVQAYHKGRYSESILLLEKALAYEPGQSLVSWWLGRSYEKTGLGDTALRLWEPLVASEDAPPFLRAQVEALRASRALAGTGGDPSYIEAARFQGSLGKKTYFLRPSSLLPQKDGSVLIVAQGSNELLRIDPNGVIKESDSGGLRGFDRPYGLAALPDGTLFVTEFNGDRIARLSGGKTILFGQKGRGDGQLLGPQYAACDDSGYLYVVDYGNARVCKFDSEGKYVLSLGAKLDGFPGFVSPAGIAVRDGVVHVADAYRKSIYRFDTSGNYLGVMAEGMLHFPESLTFWKNGASLLIADTDRIVSLDLESETLTVLYVAPDRKARLVGAAADYNGNLLACDFDNSAVLVLTEAPQIAAGYDVEIERIDSSAFPKVVLDVSVKDRLGNPVVGLGFPNFRLQERVKTRETADERGMTVVHTAETVQPAKGVEFLAAAGSTATPRVTFLLDRSEAMRNSRQESRDALTSLYEALKAAGTSSFSLVGAGAVPAVMVQAGGSLADLTKASLAEVESKPGRFDTGLRLAVSSMLPSGPKDNIIYIGSGRVDEKSFGSATLSELASYLRNNDIHLFAVILGEAVPDPALRYLVDMSGGGVYAASRARGLADLASEIKAIGSGRYRFSFTSASNSGFGELYQSVAVEAYLYKKSGRDELGYFAPLL